jgi:rod shape-determining protein MreC
MVGIFSRHRSLALLAGVVLAQVLLLAFQIKRDHDVRLVRYWAVAFTTPVQRGGTWTFSRIGGIWSGYIGLHNAHSENQQLRSELDTLRLRNRELETEAGEAQRLRGLLNFRDGHTEAPMIAAQVIGASADPASHTLFINRGERDHVRRNMGVITPEGVAGKIVEVFPSTSQVLLINDKDSGVGALLADTRTHGVVKGSADPDPHMDYVVNDEKVPTGTTILTSGEDRIFPKGLLIGTVSGTAPATPFQLIRVKAAARLDRLEDVLVLLSQEELAPKESEAGLSSVVPIPTPVSIPATPPPSVSTQHAASTPPQAVTGPKPPSPQAGSVQKKPSTAEAQGRTSPPTASNSPR